MMFNTNDFFREFDHAVGAANKRSNNPMPLDAYRRGDDVWVHVDLPGVAAESVDIDVERSVLTISAERSWPVEDGDTGYLAERPSGAFRRQVHLGDSLDVEGIEADYADGVLTLRIPVLAKAKPRKITVGGLTPAPDAAIEAEATPAS